MLFSSLLTAAVVALGTVSANPSPNMDSNNVDVEARDNRHPNCGRFATWDNRKGCVCKNHGQIYNKHDKSCSCDRGLVWKHNRCEKDCGNSASWDDRHHQCQCDNHAFVYNGRFKSCCPKNKQWDDRRKRCH